MTTYQFHCDDQMWPSKINASQPGARFIARGWIPADAIEIDIAYRPHLGDSVWGLIVQIDGDPAGASLHATADDGREYEVVAVEPLLAGDPKALLDVSRYWEFSPDFIKGLRSYLASIGTEVNDEEPRDDGNLDDSGG